VVDIGIGALCLGVWVLIEHVIDKAFDNTDLGDSDYGC
jgi:hypothetical protein